MTEIKVNPWVIPEKRMFWNDYVGSTIHDIKSPLTSARNKVAFVERKIPKLLAGVKLGNEQQGVLDKIVRKLKITARELKSALEQTSAFRDTLRFGFEALHCERVRSIDKLLNRITESWQNKLADHGINVELTMPNQPIGSFALDKVKFERVINNLLENASEEMIANPGKDRKIKIVLKEIKRDDNRKHITLSVTNPGSIPEDARSYIFDPGFSTKGERKGEGSLVGMGLYGAREICRLHGGDLNCSSKSNPITFVAEFPELKEKNNPNQELFPWMLAQTVAA